MVPTRNQHRNAEHYQQSLALQDYPVAPDTSMTRPEQSWSDALLLDVMLVNILAFKLPETEYLYRGESDITQSWLFRPDGDGLGWLAIQGEV